MSSKYQPKTLDFAVPRRSCERRVRGRFTVASGLSTIGILGVLVACSSSGGGSPGGAGPSSGGTASSTGGSGNASGAAPVNSGGAISGGIAGQAGTTAALGGSAGTVGAGGTTGSAGSPGSGGAAAGSGGFGGVTGSAGANGISGATGIAGSAGATGTPGTCPAPACGTHRWACWRMPNPASGGLPNPASYTDLGDGTVRDNVSCLVWQKTVSAPTYTVAAGKTYCASLGAGWRLATRIELMSIMDYTQAAAKTDPVAFPATPRAFFKSGSEWVLTTKQIGAGAGTDFGWAFNFSDGITSNARSGATPDRARCVKGGGDAELDAASGAIAVPPPNQYTVIATGEVQDNYTGLVWQQAYSAAQMAFTDARAYCAALGLNGHTWRLPSIRELSTLVDEAQVGPAINRTQFPNTRSGSRSNNWYWSSHLAAGSTTAAWAINFDDGFTGANTTTDATAWNYFTTVWARCVR